MTIKYNKTFLSCTKTLFDEALLKFRQGVDALPNGELNNKYSKFVEATPLGEVSTLRQLTKYITT